MSKSRIKINRTELHTREEAADLAHHVATDINLRISHTARMDAEILAVKQQYAPGFAAIESRIQCGTDILMRWAEANPGEFKGKRSIDFGQAVVGFRTGTPKLELLNRKWTWKKVLAAMQQLLPAFIRDKPEVDKEALLAQRDEEVLQYALPKVGLKVVQGETFFVEPSLTETETRQQREKEAA